MDNQQLTSRIEKFLDTQSVDGFKMYHKMDIDGLSIELLNGLALIYNTSVMDAVSFKYTFLHRGNNTVLLTTM